MVSVVFRRNSNHKRYQTLHTFTEQDIFLVDLEEGRNRFEKLFENPILHESPRFTHPLETIRSTNKAAIHQYLIKDQDFQSPKNVGTAVKDAIFLLKCSLSDLPGTLSAIANLILQKALKFNLYFDAYTVPSIKDVKRRTRGSNNSELRFLFGPGTKTSKNIFHLFKLDDFLKNDIFYH